MVAASRPAVAGTVAARRSPVVGAVGAPRPAVAGTVGAPRPAVVGAVGAPRPPGVGTVGAPRPPVVEEGALRPSRNLWPRAAYPSWRARPRRAGRPGPADLPAVREPGAGRGRRLALCRSQLRLRRRAFPGRGWGACTRGLRAQRPRRRAAPVGRGRERGPAVAVRGPAAPAVAPRQHHRAAERRAHAAAA